MDRAPGLIVIRDLISGFLGGTLREDVRLACAQTPELFFDLHVPFQLSPKEQNNLCKSVYRNTINDGDSQTSPLPIFPEGRGTSVHRLRVRGQFEIKILIVLHINII